VSENDIIVYGFGNPGRQDDGLGPFLIEKLEAESISGIVVDSNYQLNIEDAYDISQGKAVIFVDASIDCKEPFSFEKLTAAQEIRFTTHAISPQSVLALCQDLYDRDVPAYILAIRGYEWEFSEPMTRKAEKNLDEAFIFIKKKLAEMKNGLRHEI